MPVTPQSLRERCAREMSRSPRGFAGCDWLYEAFLTVPREHFVPDRVWWPAPGPDGRYPLIDRAVTPRAWLKAAYRPGAALITQIDDGAVPPTGPATGAFTSSISSPGVIVELLRHLAPEPGHTVLEIGTGTGYTTALLARRAGDTHLTTIEIDTGMSGRARRRLHALGLAPRVVCGDGEQGYPEGGPYDRIVSTASVRTIPPAWVSQLRPGGVLLTPLDSPYGCDLLVRLVADRPGHAKGTAVAPVEFMRVRSQRSPRAYTDLGWPPGGPDGVPWDTLEVEADRTGQRITAVPTPPERNS
ncbi:methyltransferase domain-containing protein [Streptomyces sp. TRM76323]|uniref:Protein-L-isoaspartate O-methyltransferase n=1 Tax=Streptomyces tamarix TaxID=3078565 RepID=A0ABU3QV14_9ACTN|nr:methyltransferase domain-containing protein [Streptomyces tamarix]MDT9686625.1 methyltransferase domain-containing protein [Streptomyces tamarix]